MAAAEASVSPLKLRELARVFAVIGVSSFGGGLSGWLYREIVEQRGWLPPRDFFAGLSLARAMPGANVVNLSIWIGYRLRGAVGALTAVCAVLAAPILIILGVALLYRHWRASPLLQHVLMGIAAAALGLSLSMGFKSFTATCLRPVPAILVLAIVVSVGVLHWPMLPVMAALAPASIVWAWLEERAHAAVESTDEA